MLTKAKAGQVGVLFDDFDYYTASTDSRLAQRGWVMRSGAGGPGVPGATWSPKAVTFPRLGDGPVLQLESTTTGSGCNTIQSVGDCAVDIRLDFNGIQHREPPAIRRCALCGLQLCLAGLTDGPLAEAPAPLAVWPVAVASRAGFPPMNSVVDIPAVDGLVTHG